jgi:hypothetical protein
VLFYEIVCEDAPKETPLVRSTSAAVAMRELFARIYEAQPAAAQVSAAFPYEAGYFFGWKHTPVQTCLHGRPGEGGGGDAREALPINPTGCARTENFKRLAEQWRLPAMLKEAGGAPDGAAGRKRSRGDDDNGGTAVSREIDRVERQNASYLQRDALPAGNVEKIRTLNAVARTKFKVARSAIHGWGLFVKEPIAKGEMLIEYQGSLIRASLNESMLRKYTRDQVFGATDGSYIFRVDDEYQVDATMAGNIARFMNHSCNPNAYSRIVEVGKNGAHDKKIVVFAMRDLRVGEELQYDYQFALGGEKIECHCGAPNCWGRMN